MKHLTPVFRATIKNGRLELEKEELYKMYLVSLEGRDVDLVLKKQKRERSSNQNAYYWAVVIGIVSKEMGVLSEEAHDYLKALFLKRGIDVKGKRYVVIGSTASLSTAEFEVYLEQCRMWAARELGANIPLPNEVE